MELPFHLRALPPEALDVLRFFNRLDEPVAHADYIIDEIGMSDRVFGKAIRRLVTKGYVQMAGDQVYRLTDYGHNAVEELSQYDELAPEDDIIEIEEPPVTQVSRRLVLAFPRALAANVPASLAVGFDSARPGELLAAPVELVVRLSVVNGEPSRPAEAVFSLENEPQHRNFSIMPGLYKRVRIRVKVFQLGPNPDDITVAGGLYVDADVLPAPNSMPTALIAYGANVKLTI